MQTSHIMGLLTGGWLLLAASGPVSAAMLIDFESETVGSNPTSGTVGEYGSTNIEVVNSTSASPKTNPLGSAGNKSLVWDTPSTGSSGYFAPSMAYADAIVQGTASLRFQVNSNSGDGPIFVIRLGRGSGFFGSTNDILNIGINAGGADAPNGSLMNLGSGTAFDPIDIANNTGHIIQFNFNATSHLYSFSIDGTPVKAGGGTVTSFSFNNNVPDINAWELSAPTSSRTGQVWADDISIQPVPEPASFAWTAGAVGWFAISRRKGRRA